MHNLMMLNSMAGGGTIMSPPPVITEKELNTAHPLYGNIIRALTGHESEPRMRDLLGTNDTPLQPAHQAITYDNSATTWTARQGFTRDSTNWYAADTTELRKYGLSNNLLLTNSSPFIGLPAGTQHIGDISEKGNFIIAGLSDYSSGSSTFRLLAKYNKSDLTIDSYVDITADGAAAAGTCLSPDGTEILCTFFWKVDADVPETTRIFRYDFDTLAFKGYYTLSNRVVYMQGITYDPNSKRYYINSGYVSPVVSKIHVFDANFNLLSVIDPIFSSEELEGLQYWNGEILFNEIDASPRILDTRNMYMNTNSSGAPVQLIDNATLTEEGTIIMEYVFTKSINYRKFFDNEDSPSNWAAWIETDEESRFKVDPTQSVVLSNIVGLKNYIVAYQWKKVGTNVTIRMAINGVLTAENTLGTWYPIPSTGLWLGGKNASSDQSSTLFAEALVFDKYLTTAEVTDITSTGLSSVYNLPT